MKFSKIIQAVAIILIIQSCSSSLNSTKVSDEGELAYQAGNYEAALATYEKVIESKGKRTAADVYVGAGKSAVALGQTEKARNYLETAKGTGYSSPEMYSSLAKVYKTIDNLSKEITALEQYREKYPQGKEISTINTRLFETYVESENWDLAVGLWPEVETQAQSNTKLLAGYLIVNENLKNKEICIKLAKQILKLEASNITALEYFADFYYWKAEDLYISEMKAYKAKRTNSQYSKLLKALKKVYPDYRTSRDYYLKLYKISPKANYAKYLGNIYTRLDDKEKAEYYTKRAK